MFGKVVNEFEKFGFGFFDIVYLDFEEFISFFNFLVFVNSGNIDITERADFLFEFIQTALSLSDFLNFDGNIFGFTFGKFIFFPEFGGDFIILFLEISPSFLKSGEFTADIFTFRKFISFGFAESGKSAFQFRF